MGVTILTGLFIPFAGTTLGALCVLFMREGFQKGTTKVLSGFAAGVMIAASVWSLLIPALEQAENMGKYRVVPVVAGFVLGMVFLLFLDNVTPHIHLDETVEGPPSGLSKSFMMILAITIHNIPEGMAVGVLYASLLAKNASVSETAALALSVGIAIQNFPEGAIVSMPLHDAGMSKGKACIWGILSGAVEPAAGILTVFLARKIVPVMPYLLSFAAGAMMYVVIEELVPEMSEGEHSNKVTIAFLVGFCLMMVLDVVFS